MNHEIRQAIAESTTLPSVRDNLLQVLNEVKERDGHARIGYVIGKITADGDEHIHRNIERLQRFVDHLSEIHGFPIFAAVSVFGDGAYDRIEEFTFERELREKYFMQFWRDVLESGHISDVFATPEWDKSTGATDEHSVALRNGIQIHYMDHEL